MIRWQSRLVDLVLLALRALLRSDLALFCNTTFGVDLISISQTGNTFCCRSKWRCGIESSSSSFQSATTSAALPLRWCWCIFAGGQQQLRSILSLSWDFDNLLWCIITTDLHTNYCCCQRDTLSSSYEISLTDWFIMKPMSPFAAPLSTVLFMLLSIMSQLLLSMLI